MDTERILDIERHCLSALALMTEREVSAGTWRRLRPEWFSESDHRLVLADFVEQLEATGAVSDVVSDMNLRGMVHIDVMQFRSIGISGVAVWIEKVYDQWCSRRGVEISRIAASPNFSLVAVPAIERLIDEMRAALPPARPDLLRAFVEHLDSPAQSIIPLGFAGVDRRLCGGLDAGHLLVLGGQPGAGKTSFSLTVAHHVARAGYPVDYWSAECSPDILFRWLVAAASGIPAARIAQRDLTAEERETAVEAATEISRLPLRLRSTDGRDVAGVAREVRATDAVLVVVDYAQLLPDASTASRGMATAAAAGGDVFSVLNAATKKAGTRMILCAAVSRSSKTRTGAAPDLGDIRDTSAAEHAADALAILSSSPKVLQECGIPNAMDPNNDPRECIDVVFALPKYRHGRAGGGVRLSFDRPRFRFLDSLTDMPAPRVNGRTAAVTSLDSQLPF